MKKDQIRKITTKIKSDYQNFDALVLDLRNKEENNGCCSNQNACDLHCSPLYGGCNNNGDGNCC